VIYYISISHVSLPLLQQRFPEVKKRVTFGKYVILHAGNNPILNQSQMFGRLRADV